MSTRQMGEAARAVSPPGRREVAIEARALTKIYGATAALAGADLLVHAGEIHALLGENGAGKSTLVRILAGVDSADGGMLRIFGKEVGAGGAVDHGCAFIHQDLALFPSMSVAANIALAGGFERRLGMIDDRATMAAAGALLDRLGMAFDPREPVGELPLADQTAVAIARALSRGVRVIVLDEPTAYLEARQVRSVLKLLQRLRDDGVACLLITHRASDVLDTCDRVTVLREGRTVAARAVTGLGADELVRLISGYVPDVRERSAATRSSQTVFELRGATGDGFGPLSLHVAAGEIVGVCGLADAGAPEVGKVTFGIGELTGGEMLLDGAPVRFDDVADAMRAGVAYVPAERRVAGVAEELTARENLFLRPRGPWYRPMRRAEERRAAVRMLKRHGVDPSEPEHQAAAFSGGNQQKIVLAKWMDQRPRLLVLNEPTAGVDLAAKADIHAHIARSASEHGFGVLLISSDFNEVAELADRVYVMHRRLVFGELDRAAATPQALVSHAYGRAA